MRRPEQPRILADTQCPHGLAHHYCRIHTNFKNKKTPNSNPMFWSRRWDLNPQPTDYKSVALPIELLRRAESRLWCLGAESNHRHRDFQSLALPTELPRQDMATRKGLEPSTSSVTGWRTNHLYYRATIWWTFRDLNPGQTGYEPVALTN